MSVMTIKELLLKAIEDPDFAISLETAPESERALLKLPEETSEVLFKP